MPNFLILDSGLNAEASIAGTGVKLDFGYFTLGSAAGYTPLRSDAGPRGSVVYTAPVTRVIPYTGGAVDIPCAIPAGAGPFEFGEVTIYLSNGTPFAKLVYPALQAKMQTTSASGGSSWLIHAILKLQQGVSSVNIVQGNTGKIPVFADFSSIAAPALMAGDPYEALVFEPTAWGHPVHIMRQNDHYWQPRGYTNLVEDHVSTVYVEGGVTKFTSPYLTDTHIVNNSAVDRTFILADSDGNLCGIKSISVGIATLERQVSWLAAGNIINIYQADHMALHPYLGLPGQLRRSDNIGYGAGGIGFSYTLPYPDGTVGHRLRTDLANTLSLYNSMMALQESITPIGSMVQFYGPMPAVYDPNGSSDWAYCNGQSIDTTNNPRLQLLATRLGAVNGVVRLPDMRGEFPRGLDDGRGIPGQETRVLGSAELGSVERHNHTNGAYTDVLHTSADALGDTSNGFDVTGGEANIRTSVPMLPYGGNETRPRNVAFRYIMRVRNFSPTPLI